MGARRCACSQGSVVDDRDLEYMGADRSTRSRQCPGPPRSRAGPEYAVGRVLGAGSSMVGANMGERRWTCSGRWVSRAIRRDGNALGRTVNCSCHRRARRTRSTGASVTRADQSIRTTTCHEHWLASRDIGNRSLVSQGVQDKWLTGLRTRMFEGVVQSSGLVTELVRERTPRFIALWTATTHSAITRTRPGWVRVLASSGTPCVLESTQCVVVQDVTRTHYHDQRQVSSNFCNISPGTCPRAL